MALTPTKQIPLGFQAPDFELIDTVNYSLKSLSELKSDKATVIMFICNHCPYVKHIIQGLVHLANDYIPQGLSFIAISSNDIVNYPEDHPDKMHELAISMNFSFPYLYDENQEVAKLYDAVCTPDFNVLDGDGKVVYRGQFDGSRPGNNIPVTGNEMRNALDLLVKGESVPAEGQVPSVGCNIKWK